MLIDMCGTPGDKRRAQRDALHSLGTVLQMILAYDCILLNFYYDHAMARWVGWHQRTCWIYFRQLDENSVSIANILTVCASL